MAKPGRSLLDSRETERQAYLDEFEALWDAMGGYAFSVASSPEELIDKAFLHGATERQVTGFLGLQETFKEIEEGAGRMRKDPAYTAEPEREAALFDQWVEGTSPSKNGIAQRLGRLVGALLR